MQLTPFHLAIQVRDINEAREFYGKKLGFPTANIFVKNAVIPPVGVYAVVAIVGEKKYNGMANIGSRPSFKSKGSSINIEVHIFNFAKTLYAKDIFVEFVKKIRNEKKFNSKEKLIAQLKRDEVKSRAILRTISP